MKTLALFALLFATVMTPSQPRERLFQVDKVTVERKGSTLTVHAEGQATTAGWTDVRLTRASKSRSEIVYDLTGVPPTGMVAQVLTPVTATAVYKGAMPRRVRVRATGNSKAAAVPVLESH